MTEFSRWFEKTGKSRKEVAEILDISLSHVDNLITGFNRSKNRSPAVPPYSLRVLMYVLDEGTTPTEWRDHILEGVEAV